MKKLRLYIRIDTEAGRYVTDRTTSVSRGNISEICGLLTEFFGFQVISDYSDYDYDPLCVLIDNDEQAVLFKLTHGEYLHACQDDLPG